MHIDDIIEHLDKMAEIVEPIPYSIASADLNLDNPDECLMIDGYRADYFQTYIMQARDYLIQARDYLTQCRNQSS